MQPKAHTYASPEGENGWLKRLSAVRIITIIFIALGYASTMPDGPTSSEMLSHLGYQPSWIGIQILFFFSGALALRSLESGRTGWRYLKSRVQTVAPYLIAFTLITIIVIYPVFTQVETITLSTLGLYFLETVTCINPGQQLPGLLDNAAYACLIQGAIWTLKWGLLFHIIIAVMGRFRALFNPTFLAVAALMATIVYGITTYLAVKSQWEHLLPYLTALRLGYAFTLGMAIWANRRGLPSRASVRFIWLLAFLAISFSKFAFGPWSPIIEISLCLFWGYIAWLLASSKHKALDWLSDWPRLAAPLYMINWPAAQILLMLMPELNPHSLPMLSIPLTLVLAGVSYKLLQSFLRLRIEPKAPLFAR